MAEKNREPTSETGSLSHERQHSLERVKTNESHVYPTRKALLFIVPALLLSVFTVSLDRSIIATATPRITDEFGSLGDVGWYASSFLLTFACFQLLFGRIYTFYNPKSVILVALVIFEIGSAICGAAPTSIVFIIGRAIAGVGASGIFGGAATLLTYCVPLNKRPMFQGMLGSIFALSATAGPLLGGAFTTNVSWRWCFYINLPIGGMAMLIIFFFLHLDLPKRESFTFKQRVAQLDPIGTVVLVPCIIFLLLALQWGGSTYAWSNWRVVLCLCLFAALAAIFIPIQIWKQENATVPVRIIRNRTVLASTFFSFCLGSSMMVFIFYLPVWFQAIQGTSAIRSGIRNLPAILALVASALISGAIVTKIGYYTPMMIASSLISTAGAALITTYSVNTSQPKWIGSQFFWGFGIGLGQQQSMIAVQRVLSQKDIPTGISLTAFGQTLGGAVFTSVAQNIFASKLVHGLGHLETVNIPSVMNVGATNLRSAVPVDKLGPVLEVYNDALVHAFYIGLGAACFSIFGSSLVEWKSVKDKTATKNSEKPVEKAPTGDH